MNFDVKRAGIVKEFKGLEIWDKRCEKSINRIAKAVEKRQGNSYSAACGKTLRQCGGRIFSDSRMRIEKMQSGHYKETSRRAKVESIVLVAQDTSVINYTRHKQTQGLGQIGTAENLRGILMHTAMVIRQDGLPLGVIGQKLWTRDEKQRGKRHKRKELPIEAKESYKWIEGLRWAESRLPKKISEVWVVGDRESDIYEYMSTKRRKNMHLLVRAFQPRKVEIEEEEEDRIINIMEYIKGLQVQAKKTVEIERQNRTEKIELLISYSNIKLVAPLSIKGQTSEASIEMSVIYAREEAIGEESIEWVLLIDKQNISNEEAITILGYYTQRWKIERLHYVMKQGFKIENLQFDDAFTLENAIGFYTVIAWHVLWLTYYSRLEPEGGSEKVIDEVEKEVLEEYTGEKIKTVLQAVICIGILGGFLGGNKRYPYPGVKSIWTGIQKLEAMKQGWLLAKSYFLKKYAT
jgi:hypothetical protein